MYCNIIFIGMPGVGKSTIGKALATQINKQFIDLDRIIEQSYGMDIDSIFLIHGESIFRTSETIELKNVFLQENNFVLSLGGGSLESNANKMFLKRYHAFFIYLKADFYTLSQRLLNNNINTRPLLNNKQLDIEIKKLYNLRYKNYEQFANLIIDTSSLSSEEILVLVLSALKKYEIRKI